MSEEVGPATPAEGLRERKKRATREAILRAAMTLFQERGFDAVTVADVARAADVSEKTVFNYFPAKEDLVFSRGVDRAAELVEAVRSRAPGEPVLEPFRRMTERLIVRIETAPVEQIVAVPRLVWASAALRERLFLAWEREAELLTPVVAEAAGVAATDLRAGVAARSLSWAHRLVFRAGLARLLAGDDRRAIAVDLREQAANAYALLAGGIAELGADADADAGAVGAGADLGPN